jgi:hypothetical protein
MTRLFATTALALSVFTLLGFAEEPKKERLTVDLFGSVEDRMLLKAVPENGVIASATAWEKLAKAWGIKEPATVEFDKELLVVATAVGSGLSLNTKLNDMSDLKVIGSATFDVRPGFRYAIKSVSKAGVKTVNGKAIPKE